MTVCSLHRPRTRDHDEADHSRDHGCGLHGTIRPRSLCLQQRRNRRPRAAGRCSTWGRPRRGRSERCPEHGRRPHESMSRAPARMSAGHFARPLEATVWSLPKRALLPLHLSMRPADESRNGTRISFVRWPHGTVDLVRWSLHRRSRRQRGLVTTQRVSVRPELTQERCRPRGLRLM